MAEPVYLVELGLTADPLDALSTVTWTDITDYCQSYSCSRGRQQENNPVQAGKLTLMLDNTDGRFDPMNPAGPYYPNLLPMRRVRVSATYDAVTYRRFTGYLDSMTIQREDAHTCHVELRATDMFKLLNQVDLSDPYAAAVMERSPRAFYRFRETGSAAALPLADSSGNRRGATLYNPRVTVNDLDEGYEMIDVSFAPGKRAIEFWDEAVSLPPEAEYAGFGLAPEAGVVGTAAFSILFRYQRAAYNASFNGSLVAQCDQFAFGDSGDNLVIQEFESENKLAMRIAVIRDGNAGSPLLDLQFLIGHFEGSTFVPRRRGTQGLDEILVTRSGTTFIAYVNGGAGIGYSVSGVASSNPSFASSKLWLGTASGHSYLNGVFYSFAGWLAEVATFPTTLLDSDALDIYQAYDGWGGQFPGDRIESVLDQVGVAAADISVETGTTQLATFQDEGDQALAHILDVAQTDDGIFFFNGAGQAVLYGRHHLITATRSTVVQATFGDGGGTEVAYEAEGLDPTLDEADLYNDVTAQREGGLPQRATDATSIAAYGRRTFSESGLKALSDNDMAARAAFKADLNSTPVAKVRTMTFSRDDDDDLFFIPALSTELWDRVLYRQRLDNSTLWEQDSIVEGIAESYDASTRRLKVTLNLSSLPASLGSAGFWILGVSALDLDARLAY